MLRLLAGCLVALSLVCTVVDTVVTSVHLGLLSDRAWVDHGWPLITLTTLGCAVMGWLIVRRHPRHPVGWLLLVAGTTSVSLPAEAYGLWVLEGGGPGPDLAGHLATWLSVLMSAPLGITAVVVVFLIAPDGRLRSPRWRWVVRTAVAGLLLYWLSVALLDPTRFAMDDQLTRVQASLIAAGVVLLLVALVSAVACLLLRIREAHGEPRRQLLWLAASAALVAAALLLNIAVEAGGSSRTGSSSAVLFASYLTMPVAIAIAVLRHRLLDIDVIVNRALVVTLATALVAVAYVAVVVSVSPLLSGDGGVLASLLTTAAVALAFQPLRRGVVRLADRLAYGAAAVPYDELAALSRRLGGSPDPATLLPAVADAAGRAVGARRVSVLLSIPGGADRSAGWPGGVERGAGPTVAVPIADTGGGLGVLTVEMPPGRSLRPGDRALLDALASAAAVPFRGARLSAELAAQVAALGDLTRDLEASRRRIVSAGDVERNRLQDELAREVVPNLTGMPSQLEQLARRPVAPVQLEALVQQAVSSLEALREITRGVYPAQLTRAGLEPALRSLVARTTGAALSSVDRADGRRWPADVEAAAYFCVVEALRALAAPVHVSLRGTADELVVVVRGAHAAAPALHAARDRVEAVGGTLSVALVAGTVTVEAHLAAGQPVVPAQVAASRSGPSSDLVT